MLQFYTNNDFLKYSNIISGINKGQTIFPIYMLALQIPYIHFSNISGNIEHSFTVRGLNDYPV